MASVSVTVDFDELCIVAWDDDYRHENMVGVKLPPHSGIFEEFYYCLKFAYD